MGKSKIGFGLFLGVLGLVGALAVPSAISNINSDAKLRDYNPLFDVYLDDFSTSTLNTNAVLDGSAEYVGTPYLSVQFGSARTLGSPVYKYGSKSNLIENGSNAWNLTFKVQTDSPASLANLSLLVRADDASGDYAIPASVWMDSDLNPSINTTDTGVQTIEINWLNTVESDETYPNSGSSVLSLIVGLHLLYSDTAPNTSVLNVYEVSRKQATGSAYVMDNFNRDDINAADGDCYWRGSAGRIVTRNANLKVAGDSYLVKDAQYAGEYSNIAVLLRGAVGGVELAAVDSTGASTPFTAIKDATGATILDSSTTARTNATNYTIDLVESGITDISDICGIKVTAGAEGAVFVHKVFLTSLKEKTPEYQYPSLDLDSGNQIKIANFNFQKDTIANTWDAAIAGLTPGERADGITGLVAYGSGAGISVNGDELVLDAAANGGLINFSLNTEAAVEIASYDYTVISYRLEGTTADFGNYRFNFGGRTNVFSDTFVSAFGLPSGKAGQVGYPYTYAKGDHTYVMAILSNEEMGITPDPVMNMYLNGNIQLYIDEIFVANGKMTTGDFTAPQAADDTTPKAQSGYNYAYGGEIDSHTRYYKVNMTLADGANLAAFRLELGGAGATYIKDGTLIDDKGEVITPNSFGQGEISLIIDREKSGFMNVGNAFVEPTLIHVHIHFGGDLAAIGGTTGTIALTSFSWSKYVATTQDLHISGSVTTGSGYSYLSGNIVPPGNFRRYVALDITLPEDAAGTQLSNALASVRIQFASPVSGKELWFDAGQTNRAISADGATPIGTALSAGANRVVIDLAASGVDYYTLTEMHVHTGGVPNGGVLLTLDTSYLIDVVESPADIISGRVDPDTTAPVVTFTGVATAKVGDVVTIGYDVDDATATIDIEVIFGSGINAETVTVTDGKFTATKEGTYYITITATDEAGNIGSANGEVVVTTNEPVEPPVCDPTDPDGECYEPVEPPDPEEPTMEAWEIILIASIGVVLVVGVVVAIIFVVKDTKK